MREFEALPSRIGALEEEQAALRREMEAEGFYRAGAERIHAVMERLERIEAEHNALLARWVELEERT